MNESKIDQMVDNLMNHMLKVSYIAATAEYIRENGLSDEEKLNPFILAEHVTKYVEDFCKAHEKEYKEFDMGKELSEIIQHVGYDEEQCGREK